MHGYYTVNPNIIEHIKSSVLEGPAYFRFDVYTSFGKFWETGSPGDVYSASYGCDINNFVGGHAVLLMGWDDSKEAWLCRNSWCGEDSEKGPNRDCTFWINYYDVSELVYGVANVEAITYQNNQGRQF
ncbi:MAG: hypothetical protein GY749_09920 [Desulfobacteraceae bacterium]|nr:hypothetical protein [Desulfobacteraceae bacterium]